jgi:hypothetical protein
MMDTVFPPSPQWHQPHAACLVSRSENSGWLVYSHNNTIQILNPFTLKHQGVLRGTHTAKINALAARPLEWSPTAVTADGAAIKDSGIESIHGSSSSSSYSSPASSSPHSTMDSPLTSNLDQLRNAQDNANSTAAHEEEAMVASVGEDMRVVCWGLDTRRATASLFKVHNVSAFVICDIFSDIRFRNEVNLDADLFLSLSEYEHALLFP